MDFLHTIWQEMTEGNFSFLILIVGVVQIFLMICRRHKKVKVPKMKGEKQNA